MAAVGTNDGPVWVGNRRPHPSVGGQFQSLTDACSRTFERPQYAGSGPSKDISEPSTRICT